MAHETKRDEDKPNQPLTQRPDTAQTGDDMTIQFGNSERTEQRQSGRVTQ